MLKRLTAVAAGTVYARAKEHFAEHAKPMKASASLMSGPWSDVLFRLFRLLPCWPSARQTRRKVGGWKRNLRAGNAPGFEDSEQRKVGRNEGPGTVRKLG